MKTPFVNQIEAKECQSHWSSEKVEAVVYMRCPETYEDWVDLLHEAPRSSWKELLDFALDEGWSEEALIEMRAEAAVSRF